MNKHLLIAAAATGMTTMSTSALAESLLPFLPGEASANVAFTTDYRYRGVSQTDRDFAIQGGFDYALDSGLYIGTWASNVDNFNPSPVTGDNGAQAEIDFYAGYGYALTDHVSLDINALYYYYPGASTAGSNNEIDFWEYTPGISYSDDNMTASLSVSYSDDFYNESGDAFYYNTNFEFPLNDYLTLGAHAGYQTIDKEELYFKDYADWSISLATSIIGLDWSVAYVDTNLDSDACGGSDICDSTFVGTISKSF